MKHVFYKPNDGWAGDFIPFYWQGTFHLFYLRDIRPANGQLDGIPWYRVSTKDFVEFDDHGLMIEQGGIDDQDLCVFTGSVIEKDGQFHLFYTGHNPRMRARGGKEQGLMRAVSDDLTHWTKRPGIQYAREGYEDHDWRDPFVFFEARDGLYHMLLAARRKAGPALRRGCTAHLTSPDLERWALAPPLWAPDQFYTHECPDLFKMGDWYYLVYSEFTDAMRTRYVMSRALDGPWVAPADDCFDTRAFYAAKTASDGQRRYLFGWNPTRAGGDDKNDFQWGGNLVVHEVYQLAGGELAVREPQTTTGAWGVGQPATFDGQDSIRLGRCDGMATA